MREQFGLSAAEVAKRLGTSRQAYAQLEIAEVRGVISLHSLARAAAVLGLQLEYRLEPAAGSVPPKAAPPTSTAHAQTQRPQRELAVASAAAVDTSEDEFPAYMR